MLPYRIFTPVHGCQVFYIVTHPVKLPLTSFHPDCWADGLYNYNANITKKLHKNKKYA